MILKVVRLECGYIVHYASGRTRTFNDVHKLPDTVKMFIENSEMTVEKYGDYVAAIVWR